MPSTVLPANLSPYEMLVHPGNFELAWQRVRYFDRPDSRDWVGLRVFAANRDHHLAMLRESLMAKTFEASYPEIRYIPKPSLTLRPMPVLAVGDRVIFQAIANVIAEKGRATLSVVTNRQSFANALTAPGEAPMFVHWKRQYGLFQDSFCRLVDEGSTWVAETDAAAFYETIDHRLLYERLVADKFLDERVVQYLEAYLPVWSSVRPKSTVSRGVPQGCLASDLLANVFLHGFDRIPRRKNTTICATWTISVYSGRRRNRFSGV